MVFFSYVFNYRLVDHIVVIDCLTYSFFIYNICDKCHGQMWLVDTNT